MERLYSWARRTNDRGTSGDVTNCWKWKRAGPVDPNAIAQAFAGMGDKDRALAWLEKAYAQRSNGLTSLKVNPAYDPLRGDPRFRDLLRRVGLEE